MDLYARFDLPPPPPPTFLSRDLSASRARFPELQTAAELRDFLHVMTVWHYPTWILITFRLTVAFICIHLVTSFTMIIKRVSGRASWVLRLGQGDKRSLIVPHAQNCWTVCYMVYSSLVLTCLCVALIAMRSQQAVHHAPLWVVCMSIPIASGAWLQLWGVVIAAVPKRLTGALISHRMPARVLNAVCFSFLPLAFTIILVPTAISDYHWQRVLVKDWPDFQHRYQDETELSREMLVDAQEIWNHLLRSSLMLSSACIALFCFGVVLASLYVSIVWRTVRSLREFLAAQEAIQRRLKNAGSTRTRRMDPLPVRPLSMKPVDRNLDAKEEETVKGMAASSYSADTADSDPNHLYVESSTGPREVVPLPIWQPEDPAETTTSMGHRHAENVLNYFIVQCGTVLLGGSSMLILALGVALTHYPAMEQQSRPTILLIALATLCYITLVKGPVNLASLVYTSFGTPFSALLQANLSATASTLPRNAAQSAFATRRSDSALRNRHARKGTTVGANRTGAVLQTESTQSRHDLPRRESQIFSMETARMSAERPSSVHRPRPFEAIVLCSQGQNLTSPRNGAAAPNSTLNLPALSVSYYDDEDQGHSADTPSTRSHTTFQSSPLPQTRSDLAPFGSYYE